MAGHYIRTKEIREKLRSATKAYFSDSSKRKKHGERMKRLGIVPPSRKGIPNSPETKKKISEALKGRQTHEWTDESRKKASESAKKRKASIETRKKMSEAHKGSKGNNWTCVHCGVRSKKGERIILEADHIKSFVLFPKLRLITKNGRTLCDECHKKNFYL